MLMWMWFCVTRQTWEAQPCHAHVCVRSKTKSSQASSYISPTAWRRRIGSLHICRWSWWECTCSRCTCVSPPPPYWWCHIVYSICYHWLSVWAHPPTQCPASSSLGLLGGLALMFKAHTHRMLVTSGQKCWIHPCFHVVTFAVLTIIFWVLYYPITLWCALFVERLLIAKI